MKTVSGARKVHHTGKGKSKKMLQKPHSYQETTKAKETTPMPGRYIKTDEECQVILLK
jgi:ribosomal protein L13E